MEKNLLDLTALALAIIGGLNWGLVGLFQMDLVDMLFGWSPLLQNAIYVLVGLAALYLIYYAFRPEHTAMSHSPFRA